MGQDLVGVVVDAVDDRAGDLDLVDHRDPPQPVRQGALGDADLVDARVSGPRDLPGRVDRCERRVDDLPDPRRGGAGEPVPDPVQHRGRELRGAEPGAVEERRDVPERHRTARPRLTDRREVRVQTTCRLDVEAGRGVADVARDPDLETQLPVAARLRGTITVRVTRGTDIGREGLRRVRLTPGGDLVGEQHVTQLTLAVEGGLVDRDQLRDEPGDRLVGDLDQQHRVQPGTHLLAVRGPRSTCGTRDLGRVRVHPHVLERGHERRLEDLDPQRATEPQLPQPLRRDVAPEHRLEAGLGGDAEREHATIVHLYY